MSDAGDPFARALYPKVSAHLGHSLDELFAGPRHSTDGSRSAVPAPPRSPQPESVLMCTYCHQRWDTHMAVAGEDPVTFAHCVMVLQTTKDLVHAPASAFGPLVHQQATTGPVGPPGRDGQDGKDGRGVKGVQVVQNPHDGTRRLQIAYTDGTFTMSSPW